MENQHSNNIFNPLPDDKMLDWSKLKQIADKWKLSII